MKKSKNSKLKNKVTSSDFISRILEDIGAGEDSTTGTRDGDNRDNNGADSLAANKAVNGNGLPDTDKTARPIGKPGENNSGNLTNKPNALVDKKPDDPINLLAKYSIVANGNFKADAGKISTAIQIIAEELGAHASASDKNRNFRHANFYLGNQLDIKYPQLEIVVFILTNANGRVLNTAIVNDGKLFSFINIFNVIKYLMKLS